MARWGKGEATVTQLIDNRHLQRVAADSDTAFLSSLRRNATSPALGSQRTATQKPPTAWPMTPRVRRRPHCSRTRGSAPRPQAAI